MSPALQARHRWTYSDLVALPDDQMRHELVDGEHFVSPLPGIPHQVILWNLTEVLDPYLRANPIGTALTGPVDVKLSSHTVLAPDPVFFTASRFARVVNEKHATAAPDLVVEILSPGTRRRDTGRKRAVYEREGVREYWMVDPEARRVTLLRRPRSEAGFTEVTVLTLGDGGVLKSRLFPGLQIPLREVFRGR